MRLSITARLALLAILFALATNLALGAFVWRWTHDDAIDTLRRNTTEQADTLAAVYRRDGVAALDAAIRNARAPGDATQLLERLDTNGARQFGMGPRQFGDPPLAPVAFRIGYVGEDGVWAQREAGFVLRRIGDEWLLSGRLLDDWQAGQRVIEQALLLSLLISVVLGTLGGLILARYVARRLDAIAATVDAVGQGDLARRVELVAGGNDAFDRLAERLNRMLGRIERLMGELRLITDSLAHDMRSPIARLRTKAESAALDGDPVAIAGLMTEADLVMRMLDTLLEIGRSQAMTHDRFERADIAEVVSEIGELYAPLAEEAGIAFAVDLPREPLVMPVHRELLSRALANLLDNALKYAADAEIMLSVAQAGANIEIAVADRGPGIAEADRADALRRFGRLDTARSAPGAGLGLALVEAVARLHDGRLELADNAPGLLVRLVLPLEKRI